MGVALGLGGPDRGVSSPVAVVVEQILTLFQIHHKIGTVTSPLLALAERIDFEPDAIETEVVPQAGAHRDLLGVDIRSGKPECFHAHLMKLAITPLLRALVAEHRPHVPKALGTLI